MDTEKIKEPLEAFMSEYFKKKQTEVIPTLEEPNLSVIVNSAMILLKAC